MAITIHGSPKQEVVAAVCLYIFCRLEKRPYMLIDFSDHLSINVYSLALMALGLDEEEGEADQLSDVCDEDISAYLATREEASVRETLWVEMNKEWIEKQEVKKAAEAAANDPSRPASDKSRRKYVRKPKAELPAAEDAAGAARNLLEAKKLSNKINYNALTDLFGATTGEAAGADGGGGGGGAGPSHRAASPDYGGGRGGGAYGTYGGGGGGGGAYGTYGGGEWGAGAAAAGPAQAEEATPRVAAALAKRAAERARAAAADTDRYAAALEDEQRKRGGGGGLGGGFLDSLTFARGGGGGGGGGDGAPAVPVVLPQQHAPQKQLLMQPLQQPCVPARDSAAIVLGVGVRLPSSRRRHHLECWSLGRDRGRPCGGISAGHNS
ncbi:Transcription factor IIIB subunit [Tetrabaena socialis]|uniref:Transcription factor IIIB subunit n=1 Tax=Tetrabaena socialis TaxID=47790 RepID=A0A2J8AGI0_9CHLO|nr:Transcription factor IIIB subunit [Tetrabaena socialis]|eukprot:PNH11623.1 Transcription factor IIIB subunit [Tetrabaena socialis]